MLNIASIRRVLMFFAHPDDESLAAGATIHKLRRFGVEVFVAIPGTGIFSRDMGEEDKQTAHKALVADTHKAMDVLGVERGNLFLGDFPDNAFDSLPLLRLNKWLEGIMAQVRPQAIFTHHQRCTNVDHQYCHAAAVVAARPGPETQIPLLCGEVPSSTGYLRPVQYEPNVYIEVSEEDLEAKVAAMCMYAGEVRPDPHPRSPEVLRALAKVRGSEGGMMLAEAFIAERLFG